MRISDWSSDVCSSDLADALFALRGGRCRHDCHGRNRRCSQRHSLHNQLHQNCVPTLNVNNFVSSPGSFSRALAISILNGPNGEFQLTPKPTDTRGLGVSPTYSSSKGGRTSVAPVGHFPLPSVPTRVPVVLLVQPPSEAVSTGSFNPNTAH